MFDFFKKKDESSYNEQDLILNVACLLIHAAKIDENYTEKESILIKKIILELGVDKSNVDSLMEKAEKNEENTNQILNFTKKIKESDYKFKSKVIEALWRVIYSNNEEDMYESNLMRRLSGLLYLDKKSLVDIKEKVKKKRLHELQKILSEERLKFNASFVGKKLNILLEKVTSVEDEFIGKSEYLQPVKVKCDQRLLGQTFNVFVESIDSNCLNARSLN